VVASPARIDGNASGVSCRGCVADDVREDFMGSPDLYRINRNKSALPWSS
jgi:hypothetical protein